MALTFPQAGWPVPPGPPGPPGPLFETVEERSRHRSGRHLRLAEPDRVDVVLVTEGTYPYARGGVSVWCDQVLNGLPELSFRIAALTAFGHQEPVYELPDHVAGFLAVGLWDGAPRYRAPTRRPIAPLARRLASLLVAPGDDVPGFSAFLDELTDWSEADVAAQLGFGELLAALDEAVVRTPRWWALEGVRVADLVHVADMLDHLLRTLTVDIGPAAVYHATSNGLATLACMRATRRHGGQFLLSEHGVYLRERYLELRRLALARPAKALLVRFHRLVTATAYAEASVTSPCSDWNQRWERRFGARPSRLRTVYNGIDPDRFPAQEPGAAGPVVAWLGRIDPLKDLETLVRAFRVVCDKRPEARLRLFGLTPAGNEDYRAGLETLVAELGLGEAVTFEGGVAHGSVAYVDAQVCVLSSISEGFPYALIEGMACGLPSVASGVGGVPEAVDADTGIVVLPRAPDLLGAALLELLDDPDRCRDLGARARQRVLDRFTLDHCLAGYRLLYQQLAEEAHHERTTAARAQGCVADHSPRWSAPSPPGGRAATSPTRPDGSGADYVVRGLTASALAPKNGSGLIAIPAPAAGVPAGTGRLTEPDAVGTGTEPPDTRMTGAVPARMGDADGPRDRRIDGLGGRADTGHGPGADSVGAPSRAEGARRRGEAGRRLDAEDYEALVAAVGGLDALGTAIDVEEVAATLESVGVTDQVAVQRFASRDVFQLAECVWEQSGCHPAGLAPTAGDGGHNGGSRAPARGRGRGEPPRPEPGQQSARGALARGVAYVLPAVAVAAASLTGTAQLALLAASVLGWGLVQGGGTLAYTVLNRSPVGSGIRPLRTGILTCVVTVVAAGVVVGAVTTPGAGAAFALPLLHLVASSGLIMAGRTRRLLGLLAPTTALSLVGLLGPGLGVAPLVRAASAVTVIAALRLVAREIGAGEAGPRPRRLQRADWIGALPLVACGWLSAGCAVLSVRALAHVDGLAGTPDRVWLLLALPLWIMVVTSEWLLIRLRRSLRSLLHTSTTVVAFRAESLWIVVGWLAGAAAVLAASVLLAMATAGLPALAAWQASMMFLSISLAFVGVIVLYTTPRLGPALALLAATTGALAAVALIPEAPFGVADHTWGLAICTAAALALGAAAASTLVDPTSHR